MMSDRYAASTPVQRMADHLRLIGRLEQAPVVTELFHHPDLGSSDLVVVTRDVPGLFSLLAGTLAAHGANIVSAQIHTREDGIAIDTFQVSDGSGDRVTGAWHWARTLDDLRAAVMGERSVEQLLERRRRGGRPPNVAPGPPKVSVDNRLSHDATVVEVKCPDRPGLLYVITRTLSRLGLDIVSARIATEIDQALDTFYVQDGRGGQVDEPEGTRSLAEALTQALLEPV
jgi:[protein-PII] uridylyltransferase